MVLYILMDQLEYDVLCAVVVFIRGKNSDTAHSTKLRDESK